MNHEERRQRRRELAPRVLEMHAAGKTYQEIAEALGITRTFAADIGSDPDMTKRAARLTRYAGECVDCGGPTNGNNGYGTAPGRCIHCLNGGARPSEPSLRRTVPVRLCDLPEETLFEAARVAAEREPDLNLRNELLLAALLPSETVYWLAESARPLLESLLREG